MEHLLLDIDAGIATLTLNRPAQRNALHPQMREELAQAIGQIRDDARVRAVILTGAGEAFCAGGDVESMMDPTLHGLAWRDRVRRIHRWLPELVNLEKPVIAAVDGVAFGAGLSLALASDFVLATPRTRFCAVFGRIGFVPDTGAMYLLPRAVGMQRAKELAFTARAFDAQEARTLGIVMDIVEPTQLQDSSRALALRFVDASTAAVGMAKSIMNQAFNLDAHAIAEMEAYAQTLCRNTEYHREAIERFSAKKPARYDWNRHA